MTTSNPTSKDVVSEVREVYGRILDRDAHYPGHYEGCWKDHWACLTEKLLDHIGRITPVETTERHVPYSDLERRMYRMFEFGKTGNTVSAQCECQALRIAMGWAGTGASIPPLEPK